LLFIYFCSDFYDFFSSTNCGVFCVFVVVLLLLFPVALGLSQVVYFTTLATWCEELTTENIWDSVKAVLRGKFIPIRAYLKKQEQRQINNLISFQFSRSVMSDSLQPHELQHARPPCPSPTPRVYPNSCPLSQGCHPTISSSVAPFSSCPQSFPASGSFQMSQLFASGGQSSEINNLT